MISLLSKVLPWLKILFEKIGSSAEKAAELEAEKELIEAQAFAKGRISPRYLFQYCVVAAFGLILVWILVYAVLPTHIASPYVAAEKIFDITAKTVRTMMEVL